MTATPTPLRELPDLPIPAVQWQHDLPLANGGVVNAATYYTAEQMRAYAEAALSTRGAAASAWISSADEQPKQGSWYLLTHVVFPDGRVGRASYSPVSGWGDEYGKPIQVAYWSQVAFPLPPMPSEPPPALATPPASGEAEAWDSLAIAHLLDERASDRGGDKLLTDAAALIRRLAAVAPAGMVLVPIEPTDRMREVMLHHGLGHRPAPDLIAKADWLWAHMLEEAQAAPTPPATAGKE